MLKNYIRTAFRILYKNRGFQFINILGLSIGIASFILIASYIEHELTYDNYHEKAARIYRVVENMNTDGSIKLQATTSTPMGPTLANEFPEIVSYVRFIPDAFDAYIVRKGNKIFNERSCYAVDPSVFSIFSWPLLKGDPGTALSNPYSIVLTEQIAKKYFGDEEAVGQFLEVNHKNYTVTGIIAEIPENSHFRFDMLISMSTVLTNKEWEYSAWGYNAFYTYLLLVEGEDVAKNLEAKIPQYIDKYIGKYSREYDQFYSALPLQQLSSIYLGTGRIWENGKRGSQSNLHILSAIAVFILMIACFNCVNLTTALASRRLKEVGLRKTFGAKRTALIMQFLTESIIICFTAALMGACLVRLMLPMFNKLAETSLRFETMNLPHIWMTLLVGSILTGLVAGIYPAFFASGFQPLHVLKTHPKALFSNQWLRKILVSAQFIISIILLAGTLLISKQLDLLYTINLGFEKERTLVLDISGDSKSNKDVESIKHHLRTVRGVIGVSASEMVPGEGSGNLYCLVERTDGKITEASMNNVPVDYDFLPDYGINVAAGRLFSRSFPVDDSMTFIMNEAAVRDFGWPSNEAAIGKHVDLQGRKGVVVGIVKDFHYKSLHSKVEPLLMYINTKDFQRLSLKIEPGDINVTLHAIENKWRSQTDLPFQYSFLDQDFDRLYQSESQLSKFITVFSTLAIFVACLGLIGLTSFTVERRFKEIGIRKVFGASVIQVMTLISKEFVKLVLISFGLAVPFTYFLVSLWLQKFSNHIVIGPGSFILAGISVLTVAWLTVSFFSFVAANTNPVRSLRRE